MRTFFGLLIAPALALACQSAMFSLATPSCSVQTRVGLHVVALGVLGVNVLITVLSWRSCMLHRDAAATRLESSAGPLETGRFLAASATAVAALSSLLVVLMWFAAWTLSPCYP